MTKDFGELTDTEQSIVIALMEPMTKVALVEFLSLSYTYSSRLLPKLQNLGYIEQLPQKNNKAPLYRTVHFNATEKLFELRSESLGTTNEYLIRWGDSLKSFIQIGDELNVWTKRSKMMPFFGHCMYTLYRLRVNSERRDAGHGNVPPSNEDLRVYLENRIRQEERLILFAKKILDADSIWSEKKEVWKHISDTLITEEERKLSRLLEENYTSVKPKQVNIAETKSKIDEIVKPKEETEEERVLREAELARIRRVKDAERAVKEAEKLAEEEEKQRLNAEKEAWLKEQGYV